ncbi:MAG: isoprenylcysteine carboxylmethyltransferase family protein [Chloroflexota bacterium]|nr:MAG: isoprenylcysteine carboxylmethyltransferase family protein [Chloroflexota bacterium]
MLRALINTFGFVLSWITWLWVINQEFSLAISFVIALGGVLFIIPIVLIGRWSLDQQPTIVRADFVTTILHYLVAISFGASVIAATKFGLNSPSWSIPIPAWLGLLLMVAGGIFLLIVVLNLAVKGFGAPFAIALTRMVATEWMYAWTRNPMVLSALAFLIGLGLWLQSTLFLVWLIIVVCPVIFLFLKVYEERELEIRFGVSYLEYKARTPMLLPKKPGDRTNGGAG